MNHHDLSIRYCEDIPELQDLRLDAPSIDELNFLSQRIAGMDFMERRLYASVLSQVIGNDDIVSMKTLINCTYSLDEVPVAANVCNDEQLGQFIIDNELHSDVNAVPEDSLYLLDRKKIGQLYRKAKLQGAAKTKAEQGRYRDAARAAQQTHTAEYPRRDVP